MGRIGRESKCSKKIAMGDHTIHNRSIRLLYCIQIAHNNDVGFLPIHTYIHTYIRKSGPKVNEIYEVTGICLIKCEVCSNLHIYAVCKVWDRDNPRIVLRQPQIQTLCNNIHIFTITYAHIYLHQCVEGCAHPRLD